MTKNGYRITRKKLKIYLLMYVENGYFSMKQKTEFCDKKPFWVLYFFDEKQVNDDEIKRSKRKTSSVEEEDGKFIDTLGVIKCAFLAVKQEYLRNGFLIISFCCISQKKMRKKK